MANPNSKPMEPTELTWRMPAEWEPIEAVWVAWPHNRQTWPGRFDSIPSFFRDWIKLLAERVNVRVLAAGEVEASAAKLIRNTSNVDLVQIETNDCWIRDYGPTFVVGMPSSAANSIRAVDWRYNAWGGKYPSWDKDELVAERIAKQLNMDCVRGNLCLEGGALETDGLNRLITFENCLVTDTRNPGVTKQEIALELYRMLGVTEIVWLDGGGLKGDDTDGHIDQLARFVDPENLVVAVSEDETDENTAGLRSNWVQLDLWAAQTNPKVQIHALPIPPPRSIQGNRLPESYCNFLRVGKGHLFVPTFGDKRSDDRAIGILRDLCQSCEIVAIDCTDLVWGLGALHCASLNQPAS